MKSLRKNWKLLSLSLLLTGSLLSGNVFAGDVETVVTDALERAGGDITLAADLLARDVVLLVGEVEVLSADVSMRDNSISILQEHVDIVEPSFLEKLTNSTIFKITLFVVGVELGRRMVIVK